MTEDIVAVPPIVIEIETAVDAGRAWRAVTEPAEVAEWFADVTPAGPAGSPYRVDFGDGSAIEGSVRALDPGRRLAYTWHWTDDEAGPTTLVTWAVEPAGEGRARVRLTHDGWLEAGSDRATRDDHAAYWEDYLTGLSEVLTGDDEDPAPGA